MAADKVGASGDVARLSGDEQVNIDNEIHDASWAGFQTIEAFKKLAPIGDEVPLSEMTTAERTMWQATFAARESLNAMEWAARNLIATRAATAPVAPTESTRADQIEDATGGRR